MHANAAPRPLRVLSFIEGTSLTGPMKSLLEVVSRMRGGAKAPAPLLHTIVTTRRSHAAETDAFIEAVEAADVPLELLLERRPFDPEVVRSLSAVIDALMPDIIESHNFKCHAIVWVALRRLHRPLRPAWIAFHHGYTRESWKVRAYQQFDRLTLPRADKVVTVCAAFARDLARSGLRRERLAVVPNAMGELQPPEPAAAAALRASLGIAPAELVILAVGRLSAEKGHADLLAAFDLATPRSRPESVRLVIVGDGIERGRLVGRARHLEGRVLFVGHQADTWPWFGIADLFVLPSHSEGSPMALLEAMCSRLPIAATCVGGVPEMVENEVSALLVPGRSPRALAAAIRRLLDEPALRSKLADSAFERARRHSPARRCAALLALYREAAQRHDGGPA